METEQNDLRQLIQRHHGELAGSRRLAVEKLAKEMRISREIGGWN